MKIQKNNTKNKKRVKEQGEVYTDESFCKAFLENETFKKKQNILEPSFGNGNLLIEILKKKVEVEGCPIKAIKHIYGIELLPDNVIEARKRVYLELKKHNIEEKYGEYIVYILKRNLICGNFLETDLEKVWQEKILSFKEFIEEKACNM